MTAFKLGDVLRGQGFGTPCWKKERHPSRGKAEAHLRAITRAGYVKGADSLCVFKCGHCGQWHLGHDKFKALTAQRP